MYGQIYVLNIIKNQKYLIYSMLYCNTTCWVPKNL